MFSPLCCCGISLAYLLGSGALPLGVMGVSGTGSIYGVFMRGLTIRDGSGVLWGPRKMEW